MSSGGRKEAKRLQALEAVLRWPWFPGAFQVVFAAIMALVAYSSLQPVRRAETNPAVALVWLIWWPLLPFMVPVLGRLWCALCPAGALGDWVQKLFPRARPMAPSWVVKLGPWVALVGIVAAGVAFLALALETSGPLTVLFLGIISLGAVALALPYRERVWCRWFCPLGLMLGLYGRIGWLSLEPGRAGPRAATAAAWSCPQFTSPVSHQRRRDCILCGQCVKAEDGAAAVVQWNRWSRSGWRLPTFARWEAVAVTVLLGLLLVDSFRMTPFYLDYMTWVLPAIGDYRLALTLGGLTVMGTLLAGQMALSDLAGGARHGDQLFRELSFALLPVVLAIHLALSLQHLVAGGPGAFQAVGIELGILSAGHLPASDAYFFSIPLKAAQFLLLGLGVAGTAYLSGKGTVVSGSTTRALAAAPSGALLAVIFWQPMSAVC